MRRNSFSKKEKDFFNKGKDEPLFTLKNISVLILLLLGFGILVDAFNDFQVFKSATSVGGWFISLLAIGAVFIIVEVFREWFYSKLKNIFPSNINYFKWFLIISGLLILGFTIWNFYNTFGI